MTQQTGLVVQVASKLRAVRVTKSRSRALWIVTLYDGGEFMDEPVEVSFPVNCAATEAKAVEIAKAELEV